MITPLIAMCLLSLQPLAMDRDVSELVYKSVDGRETKAVLSIPRGEGPFPLIVTVHGGNTEKPYGYLRTMAAPNRVSSIVNDLNKEPWAILAVSYRNGFMNLGDDDVFAGIMFGMGLPRVDKTRVALVGGSHGGYKVLQAAIRMGSEIKCVSAGSPWMVDPVTFMKADDSKPPFSQISQGVRTRLVTQGKSLYNQVLRREGSEQATQKFLQQHSAYEQSSKIKAPLLLLTSHSDESVPHLLVAPLYERMKSQGKIVEIFTVEKSPHGFYWGRSEGNGGRRESGEQDQVASEEVRSTSAKLIDFLKRHLGEK